MFSTAGKPGIVRLDVPNGVYRNLLNGGEVHAEQGLLCTDGQPQVFEI